MLRKIIFSILIVALCLVIAFLVNFAIITPLVLGDLCRYDTGQITTGKLFDLFYDITSESGYHPEPSLYNIYLTGILGIVIGINLSYFFTWTKK
jgi:hypothetical protein